MNPEGTHVMSIQPYWLRGQISKTIIEGEKSRLEPKGKHSACASTLLHHSLHGHGLETGILPEARGHECVSTTGGYYHVAWVGEQASPLDTLEI